MTSKQPILLEKNYTREHTLFYWSLWYRSNCIDNRHILGFGLNHALDIYPPDEVSSSWYYMGDIYTAFGLLVEKSKDPSFWPWIEREFDKYWQEIVPYVEKKNKIKDPRGLEDLFENVVKFYGPESVVLIAPDVPGISDENKKIALALRDKSHYIVNNIDDLYTDFIEKNFPDFSNLADVLLPDEIYHLDSMTVGKVKEIGQRKAEGCFLLNGEVYPLDQLDEVLSEQGYQLKIEEIKETSQIKGMIALKGCVQGVVKIVLSSKDIAKVGEGDILVSTMTMPKYLPAMKKAAAFVTDEGGITCHAAIISRELGKPCIIGTKVATKILKDGDVVEVDANKGVVGIIK